MWKDYENRRGNTKRWKTTANVPFLSFCFHYHLNVFNKANQSVSTAYRPSYDDPTGTCFMDSILAFSFMWIYLLVSCGKSDFSHLWKQRRIEVTRMEWRENYVKTKFLGGHKTIRRSYSQMKRDYLSSFPFTSSSGSRMNIYLDSDSRFNFALLGMKLFLIDFLCAKQFYYVVCGSWGFFNKTFQSFPHQ